MNELTELANEVKTSLGINFDEKGVKYLEGFIERTKSQIAKEEWGGLINSCGAFLGQSIIEQYGGEWSTEENGQISISFDENNKVFPFSKVSKQFDNGLEDSIYSFYSIIPKIFKLKPKKKKSWWQF
jgi:hypothetical protein